MTDDFNTDDLSPQQQIENTPDTPDQRHGGIQIQQATNHSWSSENLRPAHWEGTYLESARNPDGSRATEITEKTIIKIPVGRNGMEVTAAQAHKHGFLDIDENGDFVLHSREERDRRASEVKDVAAQAEREQLAHEMPPLSKVDPEADAEVERLYSIAAEAGRNVQGVVAEYLARGEVPSEFVKTLIAAGVHDPKATMERAWAGYEKVAAHVVAANGVQDAAGFVSWAKQSIPRSELIRAEMRLFSGDPSGYRALAQRFKEFAPIDHSKHGHKVTQSQNGEFVKLADGREMSSRMARMKGLI